MPPKKLKYIEVFFVVNVKKDKILNFVWVIAFLYIKCLAYVDDGCMFSGKPSVMFVAEIPFCMEDIKRYHCRMSKLLWEVLLFLYRENHSYYILV